ncbi:alpha/beta fold hydrolase [Saccharopolyspora sp. NPDC000995]
MSRDINELAAVMVPATYVWSTGDAVLGRAGAERYGDHVAAPYRFVQLDGVSHWILEESRTPSPRPSSGPTITRRS